MWTPSLSFLSMQNTSLGFIVCEFMCVCARVCLCVFIDIFLLSVSLCASAGAGCFENVTPKTDRRMLEGYQSLNPSAFIITCLYPSLLSPRHCLFDLCLGLRDSL